jgi:polygalacturonase
MKFKISLLSVFFFSMASGFSQNGLYNIADFGAINNEKILSTNAIQEAIDKCAKDGGGKVIVTAGKYLTGPLFLKSNITFEVYSGAELIFSDAIENNPIVDGRWEGIERKVYASLFTGHDLNNVSIIGRGKINGQGEKWWKAHEINKKLRREKYGKEREPENPEGSPLKVPRPRLVNLYNCTNVLISELTFVDSPAWTIHPVYCKNVSIEKISIIQPYDSPNTDGINPESCRNVRIIGCFVDVGDDCITIKSGYNEDGRRVGIPCENIVISDCTFANGRSAIGIGSEMSGGIKNVTISNCVFNGTLRGLRIKSNRDRGGTVENYNASNVVMSNVETAISIDMYYGTKDETLVPVTEKTPHFKDIHFSNIYAIDVLNSVEIIGLPEAPVENISIINSSFKTTNGFVIDYVKNFSLTNVSVDCKNGIPLRINHAEIVDVNDFDSRNSPKDEPVIQLNVVDNIFVRNNSVSKDQAVFLKSQNLGEIEMQHNWLHSAKIIKE